MIAPPSIHARDRRRPAPAVVARLMVIASLALVCGCQHTRKSGDALTPPEQRGVWPEPPASPRIGYVRSFSSPADLGMHASGWKKLTGWITGRNLTRLRFVKPFSVAVDEKDNLCLTDTGSGTVWFFDLWNGKFKVWNRVGPHRLVQPVAMARANGVFYLADSGLGRVLVFPDQKHLEREIEIPDGRPAGLALDGDRLYVADSGNHRILLYDLQGNLQTTWGSRGLGPGQFNYPTHLAVDSQGRLLVTDSMNNRVQVLDREGRFVVALGSAGDTSGHFSRPKGAAADRFGHVYVVDGMFDNFQAFDLQGRFLLHVGEAGSDPGQFWLPAGIAVDSKNRIFVADSYNHRVQVFEYLTDHKEGF